MRQQKNLDDEIARRLDGWAGQALRHLAHGNVELAKSLVGRVRAGASALVSHELEQSFDDLAENVAVIIEDHTPDANGNFKTGA